MVVHLVSVNQSTTIFPYRVYIILELIKLVIFKSAEWGGANGICLTAVRWRMYIIPVILSGGASGRLWPLTGEKKPKTLLRISDGYSLLQSTLLRASLILDKIGNNNRLSPALPQALPQVVPQATPKVITVTNQLYLAATLAEYDDDLMPKIDHHILSEPVGRDTAAAVANACICADNLDNEDPILVILPADHVIKNENGFKNAIEEAASLAQTGDIVSIGIYPDNANTAFGYLQVSANKVIQFIEKPSQELAKKFVSDGNFYWNSGIFCSRASVLLDQLGKYSPQLLRNCKKLFDCSIMTSEENKKFYWLNKQMMEKLSKSSIDYTLMEKLENLSFVTADMDWRDIGSWDSYSELFEKDESGNIADEMTFAEESNNCLVHTDQKPVALLGVEDIIVIDSADGILVADRSHIQNVKGISREIIQKRFTTLTSKISGPEKVKRPWGSFYILSDLETHKVKRIEVNAHASLSLQSHKQRSEHWVVVEGIASVELNGLQKTLSVDETLFVPKGARHRIENKTDQKLVLIEVQTGKYFGEDDEIRYKDRYGRVDKNEN